MSKLALLVCVLISAWLFIRDNRMRPMASGALWIPLLWIMINGSRHVSAWFRGGIETESPDSYLEGTPLDRNIYIILIFSALFFLWRRTINWRKVFSENRWLFLFFLYWGISAIWSEYPFISIKRWIKDTGNIIMALVILTETAPAQAVRAVLSRYINMAIPFSVLLILFFPNLGSYQGEHAAEAAYGAITTNKNGLGIILAVSGLFLAWEMIETFSTGSWRKEKVDLAVRIILMTALGWLLMMAHSSTALVCLFAGVTFLLLLRLEAVTQHLAHLFALSIIAAILIVTLDVMPAIIELVATTVGRDATFTGRTDVWGDLIRENVNPIMGAGYESFWLRHGMMERYDNINQAHNGYLETYLNGGLIGLGLLAAMIASTGKKLKNELILGSSLGTLLFSYLLLAVLYNLTEGLFDSLSLTWFVLLLAALSPARTLPVRRLHPLGIFMKNTAKPAPSGAGRATERF